TEALPRLGEPPLDLRRRESPQAHHLDVETGRRLEELPAAVRPDLEAQDLVVSDHLLQGCLDAVGDPGLIAGQLILDIDVAAGRPEVEAAAAPGPVHLL